jgi:hypothetical protein
MRNPAYKSISISNHNPQSGILLESSITTSNQFYDNSWQRCSRHQDTDRKQDLQDEYVPVTFNILQLEWDLASFSRCGYKVNGSCGTF